MVYGALLCPPALSSEPVSKEECSTPLSRGTDPGSRTGAPCSRSHSRRQGAALCSEVPCRLSKPQFSSSAEWGETGCPTSFLAQDSTRCAGLLLRQFWGSHPLLFLPPTVHCQVHTSQNLHPGQGAGGGGGDFPRVATLGAPSLSLIRPLVRQGDQARRGEGSAVDHSLCFSASLSGCC